MNFGEHGILDIIINKKIKNNNLNKNNYLKNSEKNNENNLINLSDLENKYLNNEKINENNIKINFIKLDNRIYEEKNINISEINSQEELIEKIDFIEVDDDIFYKIVLVGTRNIEINTNKICKLIQNENVLKIEDKTETKYDLDKMSNQNNLKGVFVKMMLEKLHDENYNEEEVKKAIDIGLKLFE